MIPSDAPVVLQAEGLKKSFGDPAAGEQTKVAVDGVSLRVRAGEVVGLVGESGSGKTTVGKLLLHILRPDEGRILFQGRNLADLGAAELRGLRSQMQMAYQASSAALNPGLTVRQHLEETLTLHRGFSGEELQTAISDAVKKFHLHGRSSSRPHELSGGERRRLVLARCLLPQPALVVADEPTAGLDSSLKSELLDTMLETRRAQMAYVFISHELDVVRYVADRVLVMVEGRVVEELSGEFLDPTRQDSSFHPYTEHLLASSFQSPRRLPQVSQAAIEASSRSGCAYLGRCHRADPQDPSFEFCVEQEPPLLPLHPGRSLACHRLVPPKSGPS